MGNNLDDLERQVAELEKAAGLPSPALPPMADDEQRYTLLAARLKALETHSRKKKAGVPGELPEENRPAPNYAATMAYMRAQPGLSYERADRVVNG